MLHVLRLIAGPAVSAVAPLPKEARRPQVGRWLCCSQLCVPGRRAPARPGQFLGRVMPRISKDGLVVRRPPPPSNAEPVLLVLQCNATFGSTAGDVSGSLHLQALSGNLWRMLWSLLCFVWHITHMAIHTWTDASEPISGFLGAPEGGMAGADLGRRAL